MTRELLFDNHVKNIIQILNSSDKTKYCEIFYLFLENVGY
jgi:hypothetical protein